LRKYFGDNEGIIELNPLGAEAPLPLVKGEKMFGQQPEATTGKRKKPLYKRISGICFGQECFTFTISSGGI
jgi:hypothetical protein